MIISPRHRRAVLGAPGVNIAPVGLQKLGKSGSIGLTGPNVRAQLSPFVAGGAVSRFFTDLLAAGSQHYTIPMVALAVGDTVTITAESSDSSLTMLLLDSLTVNRANLFIGTNGSISGNGYDSNFTIDGVAATLGAAGVFQHDGKLHKLVFTSITSTLGFNAIGIKQGLSDGFTGILSDFQHERASDIKRWYKIDEDWTGPSTVLVDSGSDGSNGTAVNILAADAENFNFDGSVSPNTWTNDAETRVIEVAGT